MTGTAFTDPYGTVYASPTPVLALSTVILYVPTKTLGAEGELACPSKNSFLGLGDSVELYPSGKFFFFFLNPAQYNLIVQMNTVSCSFLLE